MERMKDKETGAGAVMKNLRERVNFRRLKT
jgi:hypothetical protein